jgi:hypothetical protein
MVLLFGLSEVRFPSPCAKRKIRFVTGYPVWIVGLIAATRAAVWKALSIWKKSHLLDTRSCSLYRDGLFNARPPHLPVADSTR